MSFVLSHFTNYQAYDYIFQRAKVVGADIVDRHFKMYYLHDYLLRCNLSIILSSLVEFRRPVCAENDSDLCGARVAKSTGWK